MTRQNLFNREVVPLDESPEDGFDRFPDISLYSPLELMILRSKIDSLLPPSELSQMNLAHELVRQYQFVSALQGETLAEERTDANKKASVVNATNASLQHLVKLQSELHTAERFKTIEGMLIRHMRLLPKETVEAFLKEYSTLSQAHL